MMAIILKQIKLDYHANGKWRASMKCNWDMTGDKANFGYKIQFGSLALHVRKVLPELPLVEEHRKLFNSGKNALYPYTRTQVNKFTQVKGAKEASLKKYCRRSSTDTSSHGYEYDWSWSRRSEVKSFSVWTISRFSVAPSLFSRRKREGEIKGNRL